MPLYSLWEAASDFILRYAKLAQSQTGVNTAKVDAADVKSAVTANTDMVAVAEVCAALAQRPPESFREAVQSIWFLFVILQMESNASSFSPGRMDQYLWPYLKADLEQGHIEKSRAQEILDALWIKY